MTYDGHIEGGKVVFDEPVPLAEGTPVRVEVRNTRHASGAGEGRSLAERLSAVIGSVEGLPEDAAENVDAYLYGPNPHE